jgi:hypothetical protein
VDITSERLAYWFLRLNGFLTQYNFVVHPENADQHRTAAQGRSRHKAPAESRLRRGARTK